MFIGAEAVNRNLFTVLPPGKIPEVNKFFAVFGDFSFAPGVSTHAAARCFAW